MTKPYSSISVHINFQGKQIIYDEEDELQKNDSEFLQSGTVHRKAKIEAISFEGNVVWLERVSKREYRLLDLMISDQASFPPIGASVFFANPHIFLQPGFVLV
nr:hypothetical protein [Tanacetum cinerariifolium]